MSSNDIVSLLFSLFNLSVFGGFIAFLYYSLYVVPNRIRKAFIDFATIHGLSYDVKNGISNIKYIGLLPGKIGNKIFGVDPKTKQNVNLFHYVHVVGSGKNRRVYDRTVLGLDIKKTNVHIFVNSRVNDATEQISLDKSQRYVAEGDFGKYFDIYSADGKHIDSLSIFAPDALSVLMAEYGFYDLEIVNQQLYLYDYKLLKTTQELENFYVLGNKLVKVLNDNAPKALNISVANGKPAESAITSLKKSSTGLLLVPLIFLFYILPNFLGTFVSNKYFSALFPLIALGFIGFVLYAVIKNARLKKQYLIDRQKFFNINVKQS